MKKLKKVWSVGVVRLVEGPFDDWMVIDFHENRIPDTDFDTFEEAEAVALRFHERFPSITVIERWKVVEQTDSDKAN